MFAAKELRNYKWRLNTHMEKEQLHLILCCILHGRSILRKLKIEGKASFANDHTRLLSKFQPSRSDCCRDMVAPSMEHRVDDEDTIEFASRAFSERHSSQPALQEMHRGGDLGGRSCSR